MNVYVGSTLLRSISLAGPGTTRQVLFALPVAGSRTGTITIRVTSKGKLVQIDGVGVARA